MKKKIKNSYDFIVINDRLSLVGVLNSYSTRIWSGLIDQKNQLLNQKSWL